MKLFAIKLTHTLIWAFMASCVFYVLSAGILGFMNQYVYIAIAVILIEGLTLIIFKWRCPLTIVAGRYADNQEIGFDIFIPKLLAKYNKTIFTLLFAMGIALIILRNILQ
ncbi:MAG: hypothetical protein US63_C0006G0011 [Candidatus Moranbacteria bacterium GW2011_GWC2_37_8]|nr:MAG: hypothetical protein US63_C0006G0011 [Candidatus Moranbacteria bacterium GW2011_GWC2_37_8]KKQ62437.1 MAG: hypothetical protein US82_C0011G0011 [Parcubacteria group bacterium GW2011_GWC1_38_22]KKQ80295.1 MAG: hypothetical protein UT03_C0028G0011 [Candidatus Moranbacteria bacterium GW2011_GWD2_38_7]